MKHEMTHKEAYTRLKQIKVLLDEMCSEQYAPYPMDKIRSAVNVEMKHCLVKAGLEATGAEETMQWALER